ncbi:hypothetical protein C8J57DRAFT_1529601 [Mycena rebaudengoi]|nr:hypothetical protein C8J57DRAFT_1529601 [Mycena rebaudengoi]
MDTSDACSTSWPTPDLPLSDAELWLLRDLLLAPPSSRTSPSPGTSGPHSRANAAPYDGKASTSSGTALTTRAHAPCTPAALAHLTILTVHARGPRGPRAVLRTRAPRAVCHAGRATLAHCLRLACVVCIADHMPCVRVPGAHILLLLFVGRTDGADKGKVQEIWESGERFPTHYEVVCVRNVAWVVITEGRGRRLDHAAQPIMWCMVRFFSFSYFPSPLP